MTYYKDRASLQQLAALRIYAVDPWSEDVDLKMHRCLVHKGFITDTRPTKLTDAGLRALSNAK